MGDYLGVNASYDLFKLKFLPEFLEVFEHILKVGRYWAGDKIIELKDPVTGRFTAKNANDRMAGRIILRSANAEGGLESATAKAAVLDEPGHPDFRLTAWKAIRRRLALNRGRALLTSTLYDLGWLKQQIIDKANQEGMSKTITKLPNGAEIEFTVNAQAGITLVQFDSISNPQFPQEEYEEAKSLTPGDEFTMFYRGRAGKLRTMIYDCYSDANKVPTFTPPSTWPRFVGIDPLGQQTAAVWVAYDPVQSKLHVYKEYREPFGITTAGHTANILQMSANEDILGWAGGGPSENQVRVDWTAAGIPLEASPIVDVWLGINWIYALLKAGDLVIHEDCDYLLDELGSYQRKKNAAGDILQDILNKDKYHMLDALRYIITWLLGPQAVTRNNYTPIRITKHY
jgi:hypothetical protein